MSSSAVSIREEFRGSTVLLTGATGYLGGLVLEALLRTTEVARVYVLLRPKGTTQPEERLAKLLQASIFHQVRDNTALLDKVVAVSGDITLPALGLSTAAQGELQDSVAFILHTAADIRLEAGIHAALAANYGGTQAVLALAVRCRQLRALVHVSSCFVNMFLPRGSVVEDRIYPLRWGDRRVDPQEVAQDLLSLPPAAADVRACALGRRWGFPNNYTLSKHLAEQLVEAAHAQQRLPVCIVRPSLVCAALYEPIPGHVGNWAGPIGASAALALGFYHSLRCVSSQPLHVWDVMPADLVVNAILAAAAAAATAAKPSSSASASAAAAAAESAGRPAAAAAAAAPPPPVFVLHSGSSATWPTTLMEGWNAALEFIEAHPPRFRLSRGLPGRMAPDFQPDPNVVWWERRWTAAKVWLACCLLRLLGRRGAAARLRSGFEALCVYGTSKTDKDLTFSAAALEALEGRLVASERQDFPLVMRPGMRLPRAPTSTTTTTTSSSSARRAAEPAAVQSGSSGAAGGASCAQLAAAGAGGGSEQVLTWRRYFHTQLAAVYSLLYRVKVQQVAAGRHGGSGRGAAADAALVEHDFVYIR